MQRLHNIPKEKEYKIRFRINATSVYDATTMTEEQFQRFRAAIERLGVINARLRTQIRS